MKASALFPVCLLTASLLCSCYEAAPADTGDTYIENPAAGDTGYPSATAPDTAGEFIPDASDPLAAYAVGGVGYDRISDGYRLSIANGHPLAGGAESSLRIPRINGGEPEAERFNREVAALVYDRIADTLGEIRDGGSPRFFQVGYQVHKSDAAWVISLKIIRGPYASDVVDEEQFDYYYRPGEDRFLTAEEFLEELTDRTIAPDALALTVSACTGRRVTAEDLDGPWPTEDGFAVTYPDVGPTGTFRSEFAFFIDGSPKLDGFTRLPVGEAVISGSQEDYSSLHRAEDGLYLNAPSTGVYRLPLEQIGGWEKLSASCRPDAELLTEWYTDTHLRGSLNGLAFDLIFDGREWKILPFEAMMEFSSWLYPSTGSEYRYMLRPYEAEAADSDAPITDGWIFREGEIAIRLPRINASAPMADAWNHYIEQVYSVRLADFIKGKADGFFEIDYETARLEEGILIILREYGRDEIHYAYNPDTDSFFDLPAAPEPTVTPDWMPPDLSEFAVSAEGLLADAYYVKLDAEGDHWGGLDLHIPRLAANKPNAVGWSLQQVYAWFGEESRYGSVVLDSLKNTGKAQFHLTQSYSSSERDGVLFIALHRTLAAFGADNWTECHYYDIESDLFLTFEEALAKLGIADTDALLAECNARHLGKTEIGEGEITADHLEGVLPREDGGFTLFYQLPDAAIAEGSIAASAVFPAP